MNKDKDKYILRNFSKIKHKSWELYVITRIIHLLDDSEIEFVCQQYIRTKNNKKYLADLCFPELKLYLEIDELQHSKDKHQSEDKIRTKEILEATDFEERRIKIYDKNYKDKSLFLINKEIEIEIEHIVQKKKDLELAGKFTPWNFEEKFNPKRWIENGYIDVKDNVSLLNHKDVLALFGYKKGTHMRATWKIPNTKKTVWFPKLYDNKDWANTLSDDLEKIEMKRKDKNVFSKNIKLEEKQYITFGHYRNVLGQIVYKFLGEYHIDLDASNRFCFIFRRKKTKINLLNLT